MAPDTPQAGAKVAAVYELVERILIHLPPRIIIRSQRVSKLFKNVFDTSVPVRTELAIPLPRRPLLASPRAMVCADGTSVALAYPPIEPPFFRIFHASRKVGNGAQTITIHAELGGGALGIISKPPYMSMTWRPLFVYRNTTKAIRMEAQCTTENWEDVEMTRYFVSEGGLTLGDLVDEMDSIRREYALFVGKVLFRMEVDLEGRAMFDENKVPRGEICKVGAYGCG